MKLTAAIVKDLYPDVEFLEKGDEVALYIRSNGLYHWHKLDSGWSMKNLDAAVQQLRKMAAA